MENDNLNNSSKITLNLSNAAQLASFAIALGVIFSVIRNYLYYVLFLHVPIFQYLDLSDIILIAPTGIFWGLYYGAIDATNAISQSDKFSVLEKLFYGILLYTFAGLLCWIGFHNEPIVEQALKFVFRNWWYIIPLVVFIGIRLKAINTNKDFFKKNRYIAACVLTIWYATFDLWASYSVLINQSRHLHSVIKLKDGHKLIADRNLIYAGRTKNYWFLYSKKTKFVRSLKNDDVEIIDFNTITEQ